MVMRIRPGVNYDQRVQQNILDEIDGRLTPLEQACNPGNYELNGLDEQRLRAFDVNAATLDELRLVVATLINDLKTVGRLK